MFIVDGKNNTIVIIAKYITMCEVFLIYQKTKITPALFSNPALRAGEHSRDDETFEKLQ